MAVLCDKLFDTQVMDRIIQCCSAIRGDLVQVVDNLSEFRYTESLDDYGGAIILIKEGFTTYKQAYEIIKVLKEKEIGIISIIAAIGEKE